MDMKAKVAALTRPKFGPPPADNDGILDAPAPNKAAPAVEVKPDPQPRQEPVQATKREPATDRAIATKGSRVAPKRDSTTDAGDGRARRARGRNSRFSTNILPECCDAMKVGCDEEGQDFCVVLEEMIRHRYPDLVVKFAKKYDALYQRSRAGGEE